MGLDMKPWMYRTIPFVERVMMHTRIDDSTGCHLFEGRRTGDGYGQIKDKGDAVLLHRWSWERVHGKIPHGLHILHKCDTPNCINVEHLFIGTHADNMRDKANKGRSKNVPTGYSHKRPNSKVTTDQVVQIKRMLKDGIQQFKIASLFSVSRNLISEISLGKTWKHITEF